MQLSHFFGFLFDMGLPMIVPSMFLMVLALVPIIFVEAYYIAGSLKLDIQRILNLVAISNVISTLIGIPVTWFLLLGVELMTGTGSAIASEGYWGQLISFTLQAAWVPPYGSDLAWIYSAAMLFLLIPYFFASWYVEYLVVRNRLSKSLNKNLHLEVVDDPLMERLRTESLYSDVRRAVRNANLLTYGILAGLIGGAFLVGLIGRS